MLDVLKNKIFFMKKIILQLCLFAFALSLFAESAASVKNIADEKYQSSLFNLGKFQNMCGKEEYQEARKYLLACADKGSFEAQEILFRCYFDTKDISGLCYEYSFGPSSGEFQIEGNYEHSQKLQIKKDQIYALALLSKMMKNGYSRAMVIYALLLRNGIALEKDEISAKKILKDLYEKSLPARFFYHYYFDEVTIKVRDFSKIKLGNIVNPKDAEHTFSPKDSTAWRMSKLENRDGKENRYIPKELLDVYSVRSLISKKDKILVPITLVRELHGSQPDGESVFIATPFATDRFFVKEDVYITENSQYYIEYYDKSNYRVFSYTLLGSLSNGLQVLSTSDGGNYSMVDVGIAFFAFELLDIVGYSEKNPVQQKVIRNYGICLPESEGRIVYQKEYIEGNIVAIHTIEEYAFAFGSSIVFLSFESDPVSFEKTKVKLLKEIYKK